MPHSDSPLEKLSDRYREFAVKEARGHSEIYEYLALAVADSPEILNFLAALPKDRQQPNLFLAAVRWLAGVPDGAGQLNDIVRAEKSRRTEVMLTQTTQTNEPARCAALLPLLANLPQPLALLEVGASAGLCLLPDHYGFEYGSGPLLPVASASNPPPVFLCKVEGNVPIPSKLPEIGWRRGLDLKPLDLRAEDQVAWLKTLVWPGQDDRAARLDAAINIARRVPPEIIKGDLLSDLEPLMAAAPRDMTLVVFHSAVLGYVSGRHRREQFAEIMQNSKAVWISNEAAKVFPGLTSMAPAQTTPGDFLLSLNGQPVAWTGPHGQSINWFGR